METKAFFLDMDGTLLNDHKEITPENHAAIQSALSEGHRIIISSGRTMNSIAVLAARLNLDGPGCYWIACNGAVIYDCGRKRELLRRSLPLTSLFRLVDEAKRRELYIQTYDEDGVLVEAGNDTALAERYCAETLMQYRVISDMRRDVVKEPEKALFIDYSGRDKTESMRQWISTSLAGQVESYYSSFCYLEAVAAGVDKGRALTDLCGLLDISIQNTVAAGDEANDITMLRTAGQGFAMANAQPDVKAAADFITKRDNNHSGVAEIIEEALSNRKKKYFGA